LLEQQLFQKPSKKRLDAYVDTHHHHFTIRSNLAKSSEMGTKLSVLHNFYYSPPEFFQSPPTQQPLWVCFGLLIWLYIVAGANLPNSYKPAALLHCPLFNESIGIYNDVLGLQ
jgi:hypothetical protein